ncbi:endonuclease [Thiomicrorhabdus immobilis]|uniref:Endonuclease n=1 Tax=Thiomicrorhabdus immobilis TaxID=2791037 RepID=A0ABN6CUR7_9GAMM|nr:GIY-YIG nuclease family protein [Thiomicrorhabdus immobilis]BCN92740.1 endonuclease [Thiomicrorhabdus immobilis]
MKQGYIYIMTNKKNGTLYVGVTSNLVQRIYQHKNHLVDGFTKRYSLDQFVYYEQYDDIVTAIEREKQLKAGSRKKKIALIEATNPNWQDLYSAIV